MDEKKVVALESAARSAHLLLSGALDKRIPFQMVVGKKVMEQIKKVHAELETALKG